MGFISITLYETDGLWEDVPVEVTSGGAVPARGGSDIGTFKLVRVAQEVCRDGQVEDFTGAF